MDSAEDATAIPEKVLVADEPLITYADISITSDTKNYEDITAKSFICLILLNLKCFNMLLS